MTLSDWVPPIITNLFAPEKWGNSYFYRIWSSKHDAFQEVEYLKNFEEVPEVNAVINLKANAMSNGRFKVVDQDGKEYPNEPILKILAKPNWFQDGKEFLKQTKVFHDVFGNEYLYAFFGVGADWSRLSALYSLPPNLVDPKYRDEKRFFEFAGSDNPNIQYLFKNEMNKATPLPLETIIHLNENRISFKSGKDENLLKGKSKMSALRAPINNIRAAYQSRGVILVSRGANGAWVNRGTDAAGSTLPLETFEKEETLEKLRNYGTMSGQNQTIVTNANLAWVQAGVHNPQTLGLFQEIEEDFRTIQASYGTPAELFPKANGSTFENQNQARKGLYNETIVPEAAEWCAPLSSRIFPDGKKSVILDYYWLPIFQEDMKKRADGLQTIINAMSKALQDKAITIEQYQAELSKYGITQKN